MEQLLSNLNRRVWCNLPGTKYRESKPDYESEFYNLLHKWRDSTLWTFSVNEAINSEYFKKIIAMGHKVLPLIIREIEKQPDLLIAALPILTNEDPVHDSERGNFTAMALSWLEWYRNQG